jgi:hypothetical protein
VGIKDLLDRPCCTWEGNSKNYYDGGDRIVLVRCGSMAGCYQHGNELSISVNDGKFIFHLSD